MMRRITLAVVAVLTLAGCTAPPPPFNGNVHAECDPTTAGKVTTCRVTEKPLPTQTVTAPPGTQPPNTDGTQAAQLLNWGPVIRGDEFNYTGAPDPNKWGVYNSAGHAGNGVRSPAAWNVDGSVVRVSGDANGTTGGMSAKFDRGQVYYRVETRMRTSQRDPEYHPVLILWPDAEWGATCPEIDYAESEKDPSVMEFNLHYPTCGTGNWFKKPGFDTTQWHNYAVEWSSTGVKVYIDGELWAQDQGTAARSMNAPMHQTIQLDWFPADSPATNPVPSWMEVDWTREYNI